jgi:NAD(P)H-hydrate repair Nnr-like enzyme with NAD(P)H-hydrate epimerase domain
MGNLSPTFASRGTVVVVLVGEGDEGGGGSVEAHTSKLGSHVRASRREKDDKIQTRRLIQSHHVASHSHITSHLVLGLGLFLTTQQSKSGPST